MGRVTGRTVMCEIWVVSLKAGLQMSRRGDGFAMEGLSHSTKRFLEIKFTSVDAAKGPLPHSTLLAS